MKKEEKRHEEGQRGKPAEVREKAC